MTRIRLLALTLACIAPAASAQTQPDSDVAAYLALVWSPAGALPPMVHGADLASRVGGSLRYGHMGRGDGQDTFDNLGLTLELPVAYGTARTSVTISRASADCERCEPALGAAADVELLLANRPSRAGVVTMSLKPTFGFAMGSGTLDYSLFTATIGTPLALRTNHATSVMPYLVPGAGYGMVSGTGDSRGGVRAMLGGGVRVQSTRTAFGAMAGFQKVFIPGGGTLFGIGLTYGGSG